MNLFLSLLPYYLLGNFHCMGMCGPLVMLIKKHPYRYLYFIGRLIAYSFAGYLAAHVGYVASLFFKKWHLSAFLSIAFGLFILLIGILMRLKIHYPGYLWLAKKTARLSLYLSTLINQKIPFAMLVFGFLTILLPCGQTVVVFSACAVSESLVEGTFNGFAFALLTSPSLLLAMNFQKFFKTIKKYYSLIMCALTICVGLITIARGAADMDLLPHLVLNEKFHIVLF